MSFQHRSREANSEASEPLYRDSSDHTEKPSEHDLNAQTQALQASIRRLRRWLIAVSVLLGLVSAYTLFSFRHVVRDHKSSKRLEFAPEMPREYVTWEKTIFASPSTPEADVAWGNDLTPPGDGFVLIPDPSAFSLPPGQPLDSDSDPDLVGEIYDISVFHQLHCLNHVRTFLFTLKAGMDYNTTAETYESLLKSQEDHVYHCFDYIRQALMCNADLTVEWPRTEEDGRRIAVDGWGVAHQCKNWDSVLEFMGRHEIPNAWRRRA